jgi:hypothetical protein
MREPLLGAGQMCRQETFDDGFEFVDEGGGGGSDG